MINKARNTFVTETLKFRPHSEVFILKRLKKLSQKSESLVCRSFLNIGTEAAV